MQTKQIGLRIDVDTYRGTKQGVPALCQILKRRGICASFFFSVGPDNMGRHLFRLLKPTFLLKMLRSRAASLYGWDILLCGTFWPGRVIGRSLGSVIKQVAEEGHEIGYHAWDHHRWQSKIDHMSESDLVREIERGVKLIQQTSGKLPTCSAAPGWKCTEAALKAKQSFGFEYNSDCRGDAVFTPVLESGVRLAPQVPVNLPTYDEVIGKNGISDVNYNDFMLSQLRPDQLNVLTIHAEVEGIICALMFDDFVARAKQLGYSFCTLGSLVKQQAVRHDGKIVAQEIAGREGWVACAQVA